MSLVEILSIAAGLAMFPAIAAAGFFGEQERLAALEPCVGGPF